MDNYILLVTRIGGDDTRKTISSEELRDEVDLWFNDPSAMTLLLNKTIATGEVPTIQEPPC